MNMNPNEIKKAKDFLRIAKEFEANATIDRETVVVISDYINQLEAENKAFGKIIKKQDDEISVLRKDLLKRQNLEENFSKVKKQFDKKMLKQVKFERADAVKEFAERLKDVFNDLAICTTNSVINKIDNLVKEMVGDEE